MNVENRLPQAARDLANHITQTYRTKPGFTDPDLHNKAKQSFVQRQKEHQIIQFESLSGAARYAIKEDANLSILAMPDKNYCVALGSGYANAIFAGCRMIAFEPTKTELELLTTDTIEDV